MTDRSADQVKQEIAAERDELKEAVAAFRVQAARMGRRLPLVAAGALAGAIALRVVAGRLVRRL